MTKQDAAPDTDSVQEDPLVALATRNLDDSLRDYDAATLSALNRARHAALAARPRAPWKPLLIPLAAAGFAGLTAFVALPLLTTSDQAVQDTSLAGVDDVEVVENLDLVLWLMEEKDNAGSS